MRAQAGDAEIKQTGRTQKSGSRRDMGLTYLKGRTGQGGGKGGGRRTERTLLSGLSLYEFLYVTNNRN